MISNHQLPRFGGGLVFLCGLVAGCNPEVPVAETPPPPASVSQPLTREVIDYDDYEGRVGAVSTVEVRARVRGHLIKVNFQDGQIVKEKDLLFEIDPRPYKASLDQAEAKVKLSEAQLKYSEAELKRNEGLFKDGAVAKEELEKSEASRETAKATVASAKADVDQKKLDLDFTKVYAPITGRASRTQVTVGNLINSSGGETLLTTIVSEDPVYVYFDIDELAKLRYQEHFSKAMKAGSSTPLKDLKIPVNVGLEGETGFPHQGVIDFVENKANAGTGTFQARGVLANPKGMMSAGMRARVRIPVTDPHKAILITERAVGTDQGLKFVYVVNDQNVAERRDIKLGRLSDGMQIIADGLKPEDWVVVNGIQRVRDGAKVEPKKIAMPGVAEQPKPESKS